MNIFSLIGKALGLLTGVSGFGAASNIATKAVGTVGTVATVGGVVAWIFGPGREMQITLNSLELAGVVLGGQMALQWALRKDPPSSGG